MGDVVLKGRIAKPKKKQEPLGHWVTTFKSWIIWIGGWLCVHFERHL